MSEGKHTLSVLPIITGNEPRGLFIEFKYWLIHYLISKTHASSHFEQKKRQDGGQTIGSAPLLEPPLL